MRHCSVCQVKALSRAIDRRGKGMLFQYTVILNLIKFNCIALADQ